jgi:hypothetical protein
MSYVCNVKLKNMNLHQQIKLTSIIDINGAKVYGKTHKRAIYHKQRGASQKSKNIVRVRSKVEMADVINKDTAIKFERAQGREEKRISQRLERKERKMAKRNK